MQTVVDDYTLKYPSNDIVEKIIGTNPAGVRIDRKGKVQLTRMLPLELHPLPRSLVPNTILHLLDQYHSGALDTVPVTQRHNAIFRLRRYRLISPAKRQSRAHLSIEEKKAHNRTYLSEWRRKHACKPKLSR